MTDDLLRRLHTPVQWGYMYIARGGFIADDAPVEAAAVLGNMVLLVQPCPPHNWMHAPTVGYFCCHKCGARVEHDDPRYAHIEQEYLALTNPGGTDVQQL
jgi:hypothetical protein